MYLDTSEGILVYFIIGIIFYGVIIYDGLVYGIFYGGLGYGLFYVCDKNEMR